MLRSMFLTALGVGLMGGMGTARMALAQEPAHHHQPGMPTATEVGASVPLYDNLGSLTHKISTGSASPRGTSTRASG